MTTTPKKCEFCDKRGLPLLLVRDAIAPTGAGAPPSADQPRDLVGSVAQYTKRLLRSGYLNVYDEARKRWESYFVTPDGYFFKLFDTPGVIPVKPSKPFNCPDEGHRAVASCMTVTDPKNASKIWIGFSDVLWTPAVRKKNEDVAYRKRHMVAVDIKAALAGGKVANARPIAQVSAVVAEYAMRNEKGQKAFDWNCTKFVARYGSADRLRKECDAMRPGKGLIVTVPDPVGVTQELALLTQHKVAEFTQEPARRRLLNADATISAIERGVRDGAMLQEKAAAEDFANKHAASNWIMLWLSERARKEEEELRHTSLAEGKRAADQAWTRYAKKFDGAARGKWQKQYVNELEAHNNESISPLALSHVAWIKSEDLASYFECNYDPNDPNSGAVYTTVFTQCAVGTQDKGPAVELYKKWLDGDITDTKNLLLRALVYNQDKIAQAVAKAVEVNISWKSIPWDNLFATYKAALEQLARNAHEAVAGLVVTFAGPIAGLFSRALDSKYGPRGAVMALGLISGHPVIKVTLTGKRGAFRAEVAKVIIAESGLALNPKKLRAAIGAEMTLQGIEGVPLEGNTRLTYIGVIDKNFPGLPAGLTMQEQCEWMAKHLRTEKAIEQLNIARFRQVISLDVRFGTIAGLAQVASLTKLLEDEAKALNDNQLDAKGRLYAGMAALAATTGDIIGNGWKGALTLKFGSGVAVGAPTRLLAIAKYLGIAAGLAVAVFDGLQAKQARAEGQRGLAWLYGGAAVSGGLLTLAVGFSSSLGAAAIPIIGILFVVVVLIGIAIEYMKDNSVQDWLERCPWGILQDKRYANEDIERKEFLKAIAE